MADLEGMDATTMVDATGKKLKDKPPNQLNKTSRKVGVQNPKQRKAVAIKYKKFAMGKI